MEPERWRQIERLFESALEHPESDHAAFLERACAGDEELRREVASLLAQRSAAAEFIEVPAMKMGPAFAAADQEPATQTVEDAADIIGHTFAHYRVVNKLGGGGMGVVYGRGTLSMTMNRRAIVAKYHDSYIATIRHD